MQIVSIGDNLHEMSNPFPGKNKKKYKKNTVSLSSAEIFTQIAKRYISLPYFPYNARKPSAV